MPADAQLEIADLVCRFVAESDLEPKVAAHADLLHWLATPPQLGSELRPCRLLPQQDVVATFESDEARPRDQRGQQASLRNGHERVVSRVITSVANATRVASSVTSPWLRARRSKRRFPD